MNIQDLETKYKELGAEIERLKQQPEGVWEPKENEWYWRINSCGKPILTGHCDNRVKANHNVYKTEALAKKASVLQRRSNLVIQACLNFDPDFVPDWSDTTQYKHGFYFARRIGWTCSQAICYANASAAHVSSHEIANKVMAYLNSQGIK